MAHPPVAVTSLWQFGENRNNGDATPRNNCIDGDVTPRNNCVRLGSPEGRRGSHHPALTRASLEKAGKGTNSSERSSQAMDPHSDALWTLFAIMLNTVMLEYQRGALGLQGAKTMVAAPPIPLDVREVNMYEDITVSSKKQKPSRYPPRGLWGPSLFWSGKYAPFNMVEHLAANQKYCGCIRTCGLDKAKGELPTSTLIFPGPFKDSIHSFLDWRSLTSSSSQICSVFSKHSRWLQGSDPLSPLSLILAATSSAVCDSNFIWSGKDPHALGSGDGIIAAPAIEHRTQGANQLSGENQHLRPQVQMLPKVPGNTRGTERAFPTVMLASV
ncbi:hypothetical protein MG293_015242 [Ovis ammon polii]|uniref:Uncharacterized protein n=1 Tax=Ovis ammon polii TaxID=230172 RepID=A0AAD4TXE1_OVIAM|nr:hypothetical protein MG293_015242 [Ovis ammon polii]